MKLKNVIVIFCLITFFGLNANANLDFGKLNETTPPAHKAKVIEKKQPKTIDAPIDNKVYLGALFGIGFLYLGFRKFQKA